MTALCILSFAPGSASAAKTRALEGSFGPDGTAASVFERADAVAVDQSTGSIYVGDEAAGTVQKFNSAHEPEPFTAIAAVAGKLTGFSFFLELDQLAVNSATHVFYVVDFGGKSVRAYQSDGEPANFTAPPAAGTNELGGTEPCGVAVDSNGAIYVSFIDGVHVYASSGEPLTTFKTSGFPCNLAVDAHGTVYVARYQSTVEKLVPSEFPVTAATAYAPEGVLDANRAYGVAVDPATNNVLVNEHTRVAEYDETGAPTFGFGSFTAAEGLAVNGVSGAAYVPDAEGEHRVAVFGPAEEERRLPAITEASSTGVTATDATLEAKINPNGLTAPFETTYHFEWGTSTAYGTRIPASETEDTHLPPGEVPVATSTHLTGLEANKTYHWRVVAHNQNGTTTGADHTFIYPTTGEVTLPDDRAYEMVTPPQKNGGLVGDIFSGPAPDISETGSRVIAMDIQCFASSESCNAFRGDSSNGEPFQFARTTGATAEWKTIALAPPASRFSENTPWLVDANEGDALFSMPTGPAGEDEWYARQPGGSFSPIGPATPPGVSDAEPFKFPTKKATADLSHLVFGTAPEGARPAFWPFDKTLETSGESKSLYEYVGAHNPEPFLVGVSNQGPPPWKSGATHVNEGANLISTCGTGVGDGEQDENTWNALSANGHTVFFTARGHDVGECPANALAPPVYELYARVDGEEPGAHTVTISQPQALDPAAVNERCKTSKCKENTENPAPAVNPNWRDATFAGASTDGSKAFFLDTQQLTDEATQSTGSALTYAGCARGADCNLYLYDFAQPEGLRLIDASAPETGGESPRVQGVVASSADGSHVYFVAQGVLTAASNSQRETAQAGADNLYLYERDARYPEGRTAFIVTLPGSNRFERDAWTRGRLANVTPNGRFLAFESTGRLTPDDTRTDGSGQLFRYDALTGELVRITIGNDGFNDNGNAGTGEASIVAAYTGAEGRPARGDPTMSNDGTYVFFQSPVALTPHALDDIPIGGGFYAQNVYEWHEGHVYLLSDGRDASQTQTPCLNRTEFGIHSGVCLLGTDATGANVFFTTADQLVPRDTDTQVDIYDARICEPAGGNPCVTEPRPTLPPCGGEACHGIPAATPSGVAPGTASFNGEGNMAPPPPAPAGRPKPLTNAQKLAGALKVCRKKRNKHRRTVCETQARKTYAAKSGKSAHAIRRASR